VNWDTVSKLSAKLTMWETSFMVMLYKDKIDNRKLDNSKNSPFGMFTKEEADKLVTHDECLRLLNESVDEVQKKSLNMDMQREMNLIIMNAMNLRML